MTLLDPRKVEHEPFVAFVVALDIELFLHDEKVLACLLCGQPLAGEAFL